MGKVKHCLDDACTRYYITDDNKMIIAPRDVCDTDMMKRVGKNPKSMADFKARFNLMMASAQKTYAINNDPGWKEGDDATL